MAIVFRLNDRDEKPNLWPMLGGHEESEDIKASLSREMIEADDDLIGNITRLEEVFGDLDLPFLEAA